MSSSIPIPDNLTVRNLTFNDNSRLISASDFYFDSRFRKRLRVDKDVEFRQDLTVYGNIHVEGNVTSGDTAQTAKQYVDDQTGWGYPEWTFAGATYNPATDSLIMKISNIEINYATISYVNSQLQNTNGKYLVPYAPNTFPTKVNPSVNYPYAITTLASNTGLIIRDSQNSFNEFKFQRGSIAIGHVLKCLDAEGTVGWGPESSTATEQQTIITNYGATNTQYSWKVVDQSSGRGIFAFPNLLSNLYNKAISPNATGILLGTGDIINYVHSFVIGCYSNGSEMIQFRNSTSDTSPNGSVRLTGGSNTTDQRIELNSSGMFLAPRWNRGIQFIMPYVPRNLSQNQWSKPVSVYGKLQIEDEYPTFIVTKENGAQEKTSIMFNPRAGEGNFSELQNGADPQIIFGDSSQFDQNGSTAQYPTQSRTLVIAPWSYLADGIQLKNSLIDEEANPMISGFTRITGSAQIYSQSGVRVPYHYVETNRQGTIIKNSSTTETRNYGKFKVLSKAGTLINNPVTDTVTGGFQVGDVTGGFIPSQFNGDVTLQNGDFYYLRTPTVNHVLTCTSTTGKAEWKAFNVNATVPDPLTVNSFTCNSFRYTQANKQPGSVLTCVNNSGDATWSRPSTANYESLDIATVNCNSGGIYTISRDKFGALAGIWISPSSIYLVHWSITVEVRDNISRLELKSNITVSQGGWNKFENNFHCFADGNNMYTGNLITTSNSMVLNGSLYGFGVDFPVYLNILPIYVGNNQSIKVRGDLSNFSAVLLGPT